MSNSFASVWNLQSNRWHPEAKSAGQTRNSLPDERLFRGRSFLEAWSKFYPETDKISPIEAETAKKLTQSVEEAAA
jgi:hypothetical protein